MLGTRIKLLREELGLKQEDLAKKLSVSPSAIGMYERNLREPNNELILKIANFFNVSVDYLLGKSDIRNPEELKNVKFANATGLDTEGLDKEDLEELQRQIEYMKKLKKNKK